MSESDRATVLLADASGAAAETAAYLEEHAPLDVLVESDPGSVMAVLGDASFDCVVARRTLDDTTGLDLYDRLSEHGAHATVPFVLLAADGDAELVERAFDRGVDDYVIDDGDEESLALLAERVGIAVDRDREAATQAETVDSRFLDLAESLNVGIITIDTDSVIQFVNPRLAEMVGYDPEELMGDSLATLIPDRLREDHFAGLNDYLDTGEPNIDWDGVELPALHRSGDEVPVRVAFSEYEHGSERYFTGTVTDLREHERREQELRRQNERLERFASVVSHDLRNPLGVAKGNLQLAREEREFDRLDRVAEAHDRMEAIIDDLLTLAREGRGVDDPDALDLRALATDAWETVRTGEASLEVTDDATIRGDRSRVRTLFENLFRNAVEHGRTDEGDPLAVEVGTLANGFYVADDGAGVPADRREEIFASGYTTAEDGTGFGLAIVREVAAAHGWDVSMTESDAGGARVEVRGVDLG